MSAYIQIHGWAGDNQDDVSARLAKVFRMSRESAAKVLRDVTSGKPWRFDKPVSDTQSKKALSYLLALGFSAELLQHVEPPPDMEIPPPPGDIETLERPQFDVPVKKSFLDSLFKRKPKDAGPQPHRAAAKGGSKAAAAVLVLLLASVAAAPYGFGIITETLFTEALDQLKQKGFSVQVSAYDRGWLGAEATMILRTTRSSPAQIWNVTSRISHGPIDYIRLMHGDFTGGFFQALIDSQAKLTLTMGGMTLTQLPELHVRETVPFSGDWSAEVQVAPYQTVTQNQDKIKWMGGEGSFTHPADLSSLTGEFLGKPFSLEAKKQKLLVSNARFATELKPGPAGLTVGRATLTFDNVKIEDASVTELKKITFNSSVKAQGNDINPMFNLSVGEIKAGESPAGSAELRLEARKLDANLLQRLDRLKDELVNVNAANPKAKEEVESKIIGVLAEIARKAPEFEISKLSYKTKEGDFDGSVKVVVDAHDVDLAKNPLLVLSVLDVKAGLMFTEGFARQMMHQVMSGLSGLMSGKKPGASKGKSDNKDINDLLSNLTAQGFLKKEGEAFTLSLNYKQGHLTINEKTADQLLPLPH